MRCAVRIIGVRHRDREQLKRAHQYIDSIPDAEKDDFIFLLEYDTKRFRKDRAASSRPRLWRRRGTLDFYTITCALESHHISQEFIDNRSLDYKKRFLSGVGWREFLRLALHRRKKRHAETLKQISPRFYEEFIVRREEDMSREIIKTAQTQTFKNVIVIVGKDHAERLGELVRGHVRDVETATL